ncbi:huntingtin isoform X3 [Oncorhynchus mykiss]|uniref:huntingtin isoform X3 n=1 Tax=Oncorhynchus mykiss TaxID=8022 RepID=UPI001877BE69|nr:huntingtin isoform X3 [Oncorhynchus mykiss]
MATMDKLMKAFESLKSFQQQQGPPTAEETAQKQKKELATTKKDRVAHCLTICENIIAQSLRTSPEFQKLLGIAMEMFLLCSDDRESDVRMVADECLNKIIKALMDSNLPRLQLELYKEIKKNGASRSLRAALWRFAELAHLVRPQKCRPYLVNLLPCLTRITKRQEETVQETLSAAVPKIMTVLGHFANDGEVKVLLKSFVANLKSTSPTIRRTAASSAASVCQHSRRASYFYTWLLNVLLGLLVPVDEEHPNHLVLGVLLTLRYLMPQLQQQDRTTSLKGSFGVMRKEADLQPTPEQLLQVYELTLHYSQHGDHNVVTASLELMQQMFRTPPPELLHMLITPGSVPHASVFRRDVERRAHSGSILEFIGKMLSGEEEGLEDDPERAEVTTGAFTASVAGADATAQVVDIITQQPRSSQHALQPGDSVDLGGASSEQGTTALGTSGGEGGAGTPESPNDNAADEDMLSHSSSGANVTPETADYATPENAEMPDGPLVDPLGDPSLPPSADSSQTTTEGPDSAATPSDAAELSRPRLPRVMVEPPFEAPPSPTSTEGPDASDSDSSVYSSSSSSSSSAAAAASSSSSSLSSGADASSSGSSKVLDTSESLYSGMQIGTLQDEEEEGAVPSSHPEPFSQSALALSRPHLLEGRGHNRQASDSSVDHFIPKEEPAETTELENKPSRIKGPIGHYTDQGAEPLVHCVRLLSASFLLTGQKNGLVSDKEVRVSVKVLAVSCIGAAAALHPEVFFNSLYLEPLDGETQQEQQYISDVLCLVAHGDPQVRGAAGVLCGAVIHSALNKTRYNIHTWMTSVHTSTGNPLSLVDLVPVLQNTLKDESSVTCKMACSAVRHCIMTLCSSTLSELGLHLLVDLLTLKDCSYWLVRTELLETLAEIDFRLVNFLEKRTESLHKGEHHYTGLLRLQERVLNGVVIHLLGDEDPRVRHIAAATVSRLVSVLFYECDQGQADPVVAIARDQSSVYLQLLMHETLPPSHFTVSTITRTYRGYNLSQGVSDVTVENNLSRVVSAVSHALTSSTSRALTFGCCEALHLLTTTYPACTWSTGWHCGYVSSTVTHPNRSNLNRSRARSHSLSQPGSGPLEEGKRSLTVGMANMMMSLLSSAWFPLDLSAHQDALLLAGNLLAATAPQCMCSPWAGEEEGGPVPGKTEEPWAAVGERPLVVLVEQLFSHILKILNICAHVLDDTPPGPAVKATLPSLANAPSLSPIRRKGKEVAEPSTIPMSPKKGSETNTGRPADSSGSTANVNKSTTLGSFYHLPTYLKLYDVLKATHTNYKVTLDLHSTNEKFGGFLRSTLDVLSQLLEMATLHDIGKCVEEILSYLKLCFSREPLMATVCVQQLLKTLFGTNLASQYEGAQGGPSRSQGKALRLGSSSLRPGLYHYCFMAPYTHFTQALADASLRNMVQAEQEQDASGWFDVMQKVSNQLRSSITNVTKQRGDKNAIHNHIRLFEPLVIKALKLYTTSTSVALQRQVLDLLAQLVQLRVNYCLLDSDQVFIGFVLKQFEYIEVGQFRDSEAIVPNIFFFLVLLSYERYHSKQIISIPKIIQLCDGIMASGRKAVTHAIPALQPIVHDLFVLRGSNKADAGKELDTQKEVVVSMLLRLIQYHQVLEMFILVLQQCHKENEDKWKRLSRQIADIILPMIGKQQMHLDSPEALGVLNTLFETVAPSSLRPVDMLLKGMFTTPATMANVNTVQLWVSGVLAVLRVLISQSTEDIVLSRVHELSLSPLLLSCPTIRRLRDDSSLSSPPPPPLATSATVAPDNQEANGERVPPEETFARFLLQLVGVMLDDISTRQVKVDMTEEQHTFYCQQLGTLLMCLIHIFKSGMFRRITAAATRLLKGDAVLGSGPGVSGVFYPLEGLNAMVGCLVTTHPSLVLLWCQVLLIINYTNYSWWTEVHQTPRRQSLSCTKLLSPHSSGGVEEERPEARLAMCNREIVRRGGLILFCDYVCQNLHDSEHLTWLIVNHVRDLIDLSHEPPVQDFISAVHRNSAASGLFIQAIQSRCDNLTTPTMLKKTLQCLEGIHLSQSGSLLMLYVDKLLNTPFRVLARMVDTLACRRVEMLLAETLQNSLVQLPVEELDRIQEYLQISGLAQRHQRFYSLLDRFRASVAEDTSSPSPPVTSHPLDGEPPPAPELVKADKEWYVALVMSQCCLRGDGSFLETTELLTKLPPDDLSTIMSCKDFNLSLLCPCLSLGVQRLTRGQGSLLLETALAVMLDHLSRVTQLLPVPHRSFLPPAKPDPAEPYWDNLAIVYGEAGLYPRVMSLCRALSQYLLCVGQLPSPLQIPEDKQHLITTFTTMATELVVWRVLQDSVPLSVDLQGALSCLCLALQQPCVWNTLSTAPYKTHTCSIIHCLRLLITAVAVGPGDHLLHPGRKRTTGSDGDSDQVHSPNTDNVCERRSCEIMAELVEGLQSVLSLGHHRNSGIPAFLTPMLRNIIISLSRLPLVNSYTRVPPLVWKLGWSPRPGGEFGTTLPEIPVEFLQEKDVFREFLYRINTLGWSSRTQFEETWATLLGVLVTQPISMDQEEEREQEEDLERTQLNVLAVQAITSLVLSSMILPTAGNPTVSCLEQQPRNKTLKVLDTRFGRKLSVIRGAVEREIQAMVSKRDNVHTHHPYHTWDPVPSLSAVSPAGTLISHEKLLLQINTEREMGNMDYKLGQVSIHSVWLGNNITPLREEEWGEDEEDETDTPAPASLPTSPINSRKHRAGVDIHSCSQFLLELYSQWLLPGSPSNRRTPVVLISEVVRSLLAVSDLFTERNQFDMMFTTLMELQKSHPAEDEIMNQYLVPALCKAAAVLGMDKATSEPVCRVLELTLHSTHLPSRMGALHGLLYVLECDLLDDTVKQLVPAVSDYILSNLRAIAHCVNLHNQQHVLVMCAVAFYMMENYPLDVGAEFTAGVIQMCGVMVSASEDSTPSVIYHCVLRGLERLLLSEQLSRMDGEALVKLSVDRVNMPSPHRAMSALGLMLTCMYTAVCTTAESALGSEVMGSEVRGQGSEVTSGPVAFSSGKEKASPGRPAGAVDPQAPDSESVIVAMERVSVLFDRVRKGLPSEARVVARILPQFLDDFFPPQDVMNKVIGEFLSNQQPYPQFMATVVYKVFQTLHATGQSSMVTDWVLLSLSNFTQRTPVAMAMWSLSCFFISASTSQWVSALLPHVISRMGKSEVVDISLFCLVALDFYRHQLDEELDRRAFQSVFQTVASPGNTYQQLLDCLQSIHQDTSL